MANKEMERGFERNQSSDSLKLNEPRAVNLSFPPPPTEVVPIKDKRSRVKIRQAPKRISGLPRIILPPPPIPDDTPSTPMPKSPLSPLLERMNSKRRTIMEKLEGWWDLGLLDKRQTLFRNGTIESQKGQTLMV